MVMQTTLSLMDPLNGGRNTRYEGRDNCHVGHTHLAMIEYIVSDMLSSKCTESEIFSDSEGGCDVCGGLLNNISVS